MANVICLMGESGSGKTTSMRNLDPKTTFYIDCDKKGLSWRGWRQQYSLGLKNYFKTDRQDQILTLLESIEGKATHIKVVVIDTLNGVMIADEVRRMKEKGYDKWTDLAMSVYEIVDYALTMRDDLTVIFVCHTQTDREDSGYMFTHIKTSGKKLDKIGLETKFPIVLLTKCVGGRYIFETQSNFSTAKSPMGLLPEQTMDNDIALVIEALQNF